MYASPNQLSNAVFYDQTSNLSIDKRDMYKTSSQSFYTPPKQQLSDRMSKTLDLRKEEVKYESPSKYMMDKNILYAESVHSYSQRSIKNSEKYEKSSHKSGCKLSNKKSQRQ